MIRREYTRAEVPQVCGGEGVTTFEYWITGEELPPNANMMATITLEPGGSVGAHAHEGNTEVYRILSGTGMYLDDDVETEVGPGCVTVCYSGHTHALSNTGETPLVFDAVIVGG